MLVEGRHWEAGVPVPRGGRGGDLLRMDRLDREPPRRRKRTATAHTSQTEEHVDPAEPQRAADMEAAGLMTDAGRRAVDVARGNGWWTILDPVEDLLEPDDLAAMLDANPSARLAWDVFPPSARKAMLWWVISAVKPDTRERRIETIVTRAEKGEHAQGRGATLRLAFACGVAERSASLPWRWCTPFRPQ